MKTCLGMNLKHLRAVTWIASAIILVFAGTSGYAKGLQPRLVRSITIPTSDSLISPEGITSGIAIVRVPHISYFSYTQVYGYNLTTGKQIWREETFYPSVLEVQDSFMFLLTPMNDRPPTVNKIDAASGERLWPWMMDQPTAMAKESQRIVTGEGIVMYTASDGSVVAYDSLTGRKELWRIEPSQIPIIEWLESVKSLTPIAIADGYAYIKTDFDQFVALVDVKTGKVIRTVYLKNDEGNQQLSETKWVPKNNLLLVYYVHASTGSESHSLMAVKPDLSKIWNRDNVGSFELVDGVLVCSYYKGYARYGGVARLDISTGKTLWTREFDERDETFVVGMLGGNSVTFNSQTSKNPNLFGVRPKDGAIMWQMKLPLGSTPKAYGEWMLVGLQPNEKGGCAQLKVYRAR